MILSSWASRSTTSAKSSGFYLEDVVEVLGEEWGREALVDLVVPGDGLLEGLALEHVHDRGEGLSVDNWNVYKMF